MIYQNKNFSWRCISQSEIRNSAAAESEGGQKFLPLNPLPFCPPERSVLVLPSFARQSVGILFKMSSDFFQQTPNVTLYWHGVDTIRHNPGKVIPFEFKINLYNYLKSNFKTAKVHLN